MKKKISNREQNHYYIQWGIATLILLVYVIGTLVSYNTRMRELAQERALDKIVRQAIEIRGFYEGRTMTLMDMLDSVADYIADEDEIANEKTLGIVNTFIGKQGLKKAYIINNDGTAVDNEGTKYNQVDTSEAYNEVLEGKSSLCVIKDVSGETYVLMVSPIMKDSLRKGYLAVQYIPESIQNLIDSPIYAYGLVFENGQVAEVVGNDFICNVGENLVDKAKTMTFAEGSYTILSQGMAGGRSVTVLAADESGKNSYIILQPIKGMKAEIAVIAKEDQIIRKALVENEYTRKMILKLIISMVVFVLLLIVIYAINRLAFSKTSQELKSKAETDLLTGLLNKVSTENKIREYISEEGRDSISMMCVLDIDNFKKINDTMGHAFGDEVLESLGKQIGSEFRVSDIIGRTGGDEFIIFLKDLKSDDIILKEASRVATFFKNFTVGDYAKYSATASIGAAIFPRDGSDFESLYKAADSALYKAKKRGKNQLAFYKDM